MTYNHATKMKKRHILIPAIASIIVPLVSCGGSGDTSTRAIRAASEAGRRDALEAMACDSGSMLRENGVFAIRARETELRKAGLDSCANAYTRSAYAVIDSVLKVENALH